MRLRRLRRGSAAGGEGAERCGADDRRTVGRPRRRTAHRCGGAQTAAGKPGSGPAAASVAAERAEAAARTPPSTSRLRRTASAPRRGGGSAASQPQRNRVGEGRIAVTVESWTGLGADDGDRAAHLREPLSFTPMSGAGMKTIPLASKSVPNPPNHVVRDVLNIALKALDRGLRDAGGFGEVALFPAEKTASGSKLRTCRHGD